MTCVIGYIDLKGNSYLVADSAGTDVGYHVRTDKISPKIFLKGEMLVGYTSSFRMGQILQYCWEVPARPEGITDLGYMVGVVIPSIRALFVEQKYILETEKSGGNFLITYRGVIYEIQHDFAVIDHSRRFAAVGSGYVQAQGFMAAACRYGLLDDEENIIPVLEDAIVTISDFNITVSGRVDVLKLDSVEAD